MLSSRRDARSVHGAPFTLPSPLGLIGSGLPIYALVLSLVAAAQTRPWPLSFDDLLGDLASSIAVKVGSNRSVQIVAAAAADGGETDPEAVAREFKGLIAQRGIRVVDVADGAAIVAVACSSTLRERVCAATVRVGDVTEVVSIERAREPADASPLTPSLVLQLTPLIIQPTPILDVAITRDGLLVLDAASVTRYQRTPNGWRAQHAQAITYTGAWPRDLRGRLVVEAGSFTAFLPGVTCRGATDRIEMSCDEGQRPWPVEGDISGMTRGRNFFTSPDGLRYYAMAALAPDAAARWLAATQDGRLVLLDEAGQTLDVLAGSGGEVAALATRCAPGSHVLLPVQPRLPDDGDGLRLFRVVGRRLVAATPPASMPGTVTAMWAAPGASTATVVSYAAATGRYEAFHVGISCGG